MGEENDVGAQGKAGEEADQTVGGFTRTLSRFWPQVKSSVLAPSYFELEAERPLFKSHMPSGALTVDDKL